MEENQTVTSIAVVGDCMKKWGGKESIEAFNQQIGRQFYDRMETAIIQAKHHNGWFAEQEVRRSFREWGEVLTEENIREWIKPYKRVEFPKKVGLILAGNIPLVGWHDILATILSGNRAKIKMSRSDDQLMPLLLEVLMFIDPYLKDNVEIVGKLEDVDAVIATGSDNSARYFEKYFGDKSNVIRKNRTSLAVLTGKETKEELKKLGDDIFAYFGMGCRNVSHLLLPKDYDLNQLFAAITSYGEVINHHKYANNYDYYKAIYLMNQEKIIENGFVLMRENKELFAPVAVLHYHFYEHKEEVNEYLEKYEDKIQVVIGKGYETFGKAQSPVLQDYADGVNTLDFLTSL